MSHNKDVGRGLAPRSFGRIAVALAAVLALTVSFAAWSSASAARPSKAKTTKISKKQCAADKAAGTINYVSPFAYSGTAGVIDVFEAEHLGYFKALCLNVSINAGAQSPQVLLANDTAQISSTANAGNVMNYIAEGDPLVGVATLGKFSASTILLNSSLKASTPQKTLQNLEGKTFGYYNNFSVAYVQLLQKAGVDLSKVKIVKLTNRSPSVIENQAQGIAAFLNSQDLEAREEKIPYTEVTPSQLGIKGTSTVYYMSKKFEQAHTVAATNFMRADLKALQYCLVHTKPCVQNIANVATSAGEGAVYGFNENSPTWVAAAKSLKAAPTKPLGVQTTNLWLTEYDALKTYGEESERLSGTPVSKVSPPALKSMMNTTMVAGLYKSGKLVWP